MAVDVVTEFGANTKKFDSAVEKSSKKAQKNLENIGKGARVAGGRIGELSEKFNNLATGGKLGLITAGIGTISLALQKVVDLSQSMFKGAVEDSKDIVSDLKAMNQINAKFTNDRAAAHDTLRRAFGKKDLTHTEIEEVNNAIQLLEKWENITGLSVVNRQLKGYSEDIDERISRAVTQRKIEDKSREIAGTMNTLNANNAYIDYLRNGNTNSLAGWLQKARGWLGLDDDKVLQASKENVQISRDIAAAEMERRKLADDANRTKAKSSAFFKDAEEAERRKAEEESRKKQLKELTEKRSGISFLPGGSSQMFTNSLTSRGGWAGGGKVWDTNRFQQQILQYNAQQQSTLQNIEKQIEELQRI